MSPVRWIFACANAVRKSPLFLQALRLVAYPEKPQTARLTGSVSVMVILLLLGIGKVSLVRFDGMINDTSVICPFGVLVTGAVIAIFSLVVMGLLVTGAVISIEERD